MEKTDIVLFNKENAIEILKQFEFMFSPEEEGMIILDNNGEIIHCTTCEKPLTVETVGNVAHGSRLLFCENPLCFARWVAKNKIK